MRLGRVVKLKLVGFIFAFIFSIILQAESANTKQGPSDAVLDGLIFAIHNNEPEKVKSVLESENIDMKQYSYLVHSALDKPRVLEMLLEKGADPDVREGPNNNTPLFEIMEIITMTSFRTVGPMEQWLESVDILLKHGADPNAGGGNSDYAETPFLLAAFYITTETVRHAFMSMLNNGGDVTDTRSMHKNTALHHIANSFNLWTRTNTPQMDVELSQVALELIERGADINAVNKPGYTPEALAARGRLRDLLRAYTLSTSSRIRVALKELVFAVHDDQPEKVESIIESENIDIRENSFLVHSALDKPEVLDVLLKKGANPNVRDSSNNTPLYRIVDKDFNSPSLRKQSVDILLKHGANPNAGGGNSDYAETPFLLAAFYVRHEGVKDAFMSMLNNGGDVTDTRSKHGYTVLHLAVASSGKTTSDKERGVAEVVTAVLERGVGINVLNGRGQTPLDVSNSIFSNDFLKIRGGKKSSELSVEHRGGLLTVVKQKLIRRFCY